MLVIFFASLPRKKAVGVFRRRRGRLPFDHRRAQATFDQAVMLVNGSRQVNDSHGFNGPSGHGFLGSDNHGFHGFNGSTRQTMDLADFTDEMKVALPVGCRKAKKRGNSSVLSAKSVVDLRG
jgi:hypothetical protein